MAAVRETSRSGEPSGAAKVPCVAVLPVPSRAIHVASPVPVLEKASDGLSTNSCAVDTFAGGDHWADAGAAATRRSPIVSSVRMWVETDARAQLLRERQRRQERGAGEGPHRVAAVSLPAVAKVLP